MEEIESGSLYPSTLFHFTKEKEALFGILASNFKISYAKETIVGRSQTKVFHVPMVSFCDLRLSEVATHMKRYGKYGIGMSKQWAVSKGLNPVAYWSSQARLIDNIQKKLEADYADIFGEVDTVKTIHKTRNYGNLIDVFRFVKNYEGRLVRASGKVIDPYRFADEREWRYVPEDKDQFPPFLSEGANKRDYNNQICERLEFVPDDIRYIIVSDEEERLEMIEHIKVGTEKGMKYGNEAVVRLTSRILTAEQIWNDV